MRVKPKTKLWTCPKCKRKFRRHGQLHSCRPFPLAKHFENKPESKALYQKLKRQLEHDLGSYKVESLECCIHLVSTIAFAAVKVFKSKIRVDFTLNRKISNHRFADSTQMSAHRYLYCVDVTTEADINSELIEWIKEARDNEG